MKRFPDPNTSTHSEMQQDIHVVTGLTQTYLVMHGHNVVCKFGAGMKDEFPRDMEWKVDFSEV